MREAFGRDAEDKPGKSWEEKEMRARKGFDELAQMLEDAGRHDDPVLQNIQNWLTACRLGGADAMTVDEAVETLAALHPGRKFSLTFQRHADGHEQFLIFSVGGSPNLTGFSTRGWEHAIREMEELQIAENRHGHPAEPEGRPALLRRQAI